MGNLVSHPTNLSFYFSFLLNKNQFECALFVLCVYFTFITTEKKKNITCFTAKMKSNDKNNMLNAMSRRERKKSIRRIIIDSKKNEDVKEGRKTKEKKKHRL